MQHTSTAVRPNPLAELAFTIVVPSLVLTFAGERIGNVASLAMALALPVGWAVWDMHRRRRVSAMVLVGLASTLLTGGIGLMQLDAQWLALKEAGISALLGLAVAASAWTRRPLIHSLVFDAAVLDTPRIERALAERGTAAAFESRLRLATLYLAGTFFFGAGASYLLTRRIVTSATGSDAFNAELGRLTLLGWPLVTLPSMLMIWALLWWLARAAQRLTGLKVSDLFGSHH